MKVKELLGKYACDCGTKIRIIDYLWSDMINPLEIMFEGAESKLPVKYGDYEVYDFWAYAPNSLEITITGGRT